MTVITSSTSATASQTKTRRIIIIDDSLEDRAEVRRLLLRGSAHRYTFIEAENGVAGLAAALNPGALPDCVVLDYNLPDLNAPDVLAALAGPDGLPICPVVVLTGGIEAEYGRVVLRAGAQDYISKDGLTPSGLNRVIENGVERLEMARELLARNAALSRSERDLQSLADNTPDVLARFDREFRYVFVNAAAEKSTGRARKDFSGKTSREMGFSPKLSDLWESNLEQVFTKGEQSSLEFSYQAPCGGNHFASVRLVPEFGPCGSVEHVLSVTHDVTDRKTYEEALAKADQLKDEFIATLAHELRNPLAPVRTGLKVLRITKDDEVFRKTLAMMDRQLGQMTRLIDDLLDVSRITSSKVQLRIERISMRAIVEAAVEAARPILETARHTLVVKLPPQPLWLDADPTRLAQVIGNLLNNAAKYSQDESHIHLSVSQQGSQVVIKVSDTGLGIPEDMLSQVFEMFTQVNRTLDRAQGGLGIGLALVKQLVEMHNGSVVAESAGTGEGSTFTVRLPVAAAPPLGVEVVTPAVDAKTVSKRRILVVDDNVDGATTLAIMLGLSGHKTRTAFSGREALKVSAEFAPEIVFLDIGLPDMTGYDVARQFRNDLKWHNLILVALTGWGSQDDLNRSTEAGFDIHLTKPVEPSVFDDVLDRFEALIQAQS